MAVKADDRLAQVTVKAVSTVLCFGVLDSVIAHCDSDRQMKYIYVLVPLNHPQFAGSNIIVLYLRPQIGVKEPCGLLRVHSFFPN